MANVAVVSCLSCSTGDAKSADMLCVRMILAFIMVGQKRELVALRLSGSWNDRATINHSEGLC